MSKLKMKDIRNAFFNGPVDKQIKAGNHSVKENKYYYKRYCLAELTDTEFIINPNNSYWPHGDWYGMWAGDLMYKFVNRGKEDKYFGLWSDDNQYPFVCNKGWGYGYPAIMFYGPLIIDRKTLKVKNAIDSKYVLAKLNKVRTLYRAQHMISCCEHFSIEIPNTVTSKLIGRILRNSYYSIENKVETLFKLPLDINHKQEIKKGLISAIAKTDRIYSIDNIRSAVEKYFTKENAPDLYEVLMPKWVVLHLEGK